MRSILVLVLALILVLVLVLVLILILVLILVLVVFALRLTILAWTIGAIRISIGATRARRLGGWSIAECVTECFSVLQAKFCLILSLG